MIIDELKEKFAVIAEHAPATETVHGERGTDLEVTVPAERVADAARIMDDAIFMLEAVTGIDRPADMRIELVYDYALSGSGLRVTVRAHVPREKPELPTLSAVFPGADWHERETHDMFGVVFAGHPDLTPLLLPEDADFHPLRKDFQR